MELLTVVLVSVVVASGLGLLVVLGVHAVRWARRNRAAAAEALLDLQVRSLPSADAGGDTGWWSDFTRWLGDQVDAVADGASLDGCDHDGGDCDGGDD